MSDQDLTLEIKSAFKHKETQHYLATLQQIKLFVDTRLSDLSGKSNEERLQDMFNALLNIRDLASSEVIDFQYSTRVSNFLDSYHRKKEVEADDAARFEELQNEDPKKNPDASKGG